MNNYETLFIIKPTLTDEETQAQIEKVSQILQDEDAEILAINEIGMRKLAYPIQKNERGYYVVVYFKAKGAVIAELERKLKFNEDVLKYLTVKYTKQKEMAYYNNAVANATSIKKVQESEAPVKEEPKTEEVEAPKEEATQTAQEETKVEETATAESNAQA